MTQLLCHLFGDYVLQNQWMAENKTKKTDEGVNACLLHAFVYTLSFIFFLSASPHAALVIFGTHFLIDHYRLARLWTQFYKIGVGSPPYVEFWLNVIVDNSFHLLINFLALTYL